MDRGLDLAAVGATALENVEVRKGGFGDLNFQNEVHMAESCAERVGGQA